MTDAQPIVIASFIDGQAARPGSQHFVLVRPSDNHPIGVILEAGAEGVEAAVQRAKAAGLAFGKLPLHDRIALLQAGAAAMEAAAEALAELICEDVGKPIRLARGEVKRGIEFMRACAAATAHLHGETVPLDTSAQGAGATGFVVRLPYGVVAAITPFNAPINLLVQKLAPAIAAGNAVIVKPAPAGLRVALLLAERLVQAGWPPGLFNVLSGDRETAALLVAHPGVRAVSFTGSTGGGEALARLAGAKKFLSELGSNAANIVFADADLPVAAKKIASASFEASGQQCISAQRIMVERRALDAFLDAFLREVGALKVGRADDPTVDIGPMISEAAALRIMAVYQDACALGAISVLAPTRQGAIVSPAILRDVEPDARIWREEAFGPIVAISTFETPEQALAQANDSEFGLQGAVFTSNLGTAFQFVRDFDVGSMWINEASRFRLDMYPFGGVKNSGVGREGVRYAIEELSQLKFIGIRA